MSLQSADLELVAMSEGDLEDIYTAALCSNDMADFVPMSDIIASLEGGLGQKLGPLVVPLETELWVGRKGMVFRCGTTIVVAFEATKNNELEANAWSHGTDDDAWSLPITRYVDGRQVHAFYLDMWLGMRKVALPAISYEIDELKKEGKAPSRLLITGHSMGGGISTLAIMDIVEDLRKEYGSRNPNPRAWAVDDQLGSLVRHITFTEFGASGEDYNIHLNEFYKRYSIPAWDFVHPHDFTCGIHMPFFRAPHGHRYVLPDQAVKPFEKEYGDQRHEMSGYVKSMEWLRDHPQKLDSMYQY